MKKTVVSRIYKKSNIKWESGSLKQTPQERWESIPETAPTKGRLVPG